MSVIQLNRAYRVSVGNPSLKLVLIMIADAVEDDGSGWVPVSRMVQWSELSERFIRKAIVQLKQKALILVDSQAGGYRSNSYQLDLPTWDKEKPEHRAIADAWKVHTMHPKGAPDAGCTTDILHTMHPVGAPDAGGTVHPVHPEGAPDAPNPSSPSVTRQNPSLGAGAQKISGERPIFPDGYPVALIEPLTAWWDHRRERGSPFKARGWASVRDAALKHSAEVVRATVERSIQCDWPGVFFEKMEKELKQVDHGASITMEPFWKKKEGAEQRAMFDGMEKPVDAGAAPDGWQTASDALFSFVWGDWREVPAANQADIVRHLARTATAEKKERGAAA